MSRSQRQTSGGTVEGLPIGRGAGFGAAAYVVGFVITYIFIEIESDGELSRVPEAFSTMGFDIGTIDFVGWFFYSAHFVDFEASVEGMGQSNSQSGNLISEASSLTIPEPVWYLVPIVCLVGAGFVVAKTIAQSGDTGQAFQAGASVVAGYLPLAAIGAFIFTKSQDTMGVSISMGPSMLMAIVLAGIVFPVIFGGIGGILASATTSSRGRQYQGRR
jgi:hypothetical protein